MFNGRRAALALASLVLLGLAWFYIAPAPIGRAAYVTTFGNSMEPRIHKGDLIVARPAPSYKVGDAIAYHSETLEQIVFHRIVAVEGDRFVTKGDHNTWLDQDRPTRREILGKEALHLAGAGTILQDLRKPAIFSVFAGGAIFAFKRFGSSRRTYRRQKILPRFEMPARSEAGKTNTWAIVAVGAGCLAILAVSFTRPVNNASSRDVTLNHRGEFSYSASVPGSEAVYVDGVLKTGDPVYSRLLNQVNVGFKYHLESDVRIEAQATMELFAEIRDTSGWSRRATLQPSTPMTLTTGTEAVASGVLDVSTLAGMTDKLEDMTGLTRDAYTVVLKASVHLNGESNGQTVAEVFEPELTFALDALQLQLQVASGKPQDALMPSGGGLLQLPVKQTNTLLGAPILFLRSVSVLGLCATLLFALPLLRGIRRRPVVSETERINVRHKKLLLPVTSFQVNVSGRIHETASFESLKRLAELHDQVIYTWTRDGGATYAVEHEGVLHRYATGDAPKQEHEESRDAADVA